MGAGLGCSTSGTQGMLLSECHVGKSLPVSLLVPAARLGRPRPLHQRHITAGTSRVTEQQRDLSNPSHPSQKQGAGARRGVGP